MFKRVAPYIGEYKKYTVWATVMMSIGIIANIAPYFFLYQIKNHLFHRTHHESLLPLGAHRLSMGGHVFAVKRKYLNAAFYIFTENSIRRSAVYDDRFRR